MDQDRTDNLTIESIIEYSLKKDLESLQEAFLTGHWGRVAIISERMAYTAGDINWAARKRAK